jgi:acyl-CoA reductase-like NAD-dependent aldehyde dehydrogenase
MANLPEAGARSAGGFSNRSQSAGGRQGRRTPFGGSKRSGIGREGKPKRLRDRRTAYKGKS